MTAHCSGLLFFLAFYSCLKTSLSKKTLLKTLFQNLFWHYCIWLYTPIISTLLIVASKRRNSELDREFCNGPPTTIPIKLSCSLGTATYCFLICYIPQTQVSCVPSLERVMYAIHPTQPANNQLGKVPLSKETKSYF